MVNYFMNKIQDHKFERSGTLHTRSRQTVTPVLHKDAIKQERNTTDGIKSTQEYFRGH